MSSKVFNALPLIGANYIKTDKLSEMTYMAFTGSTATEVNIYIDLNSVLSKLLTPIYDVTSRIGDYEIASGILNMVAHYRYFFWKKLGVSTRFFFVYSWMNSPNLKVYYPNYNLSANSNTIFIKDKIEMITMNLSILEKMVPYISNCSITIGTVEPAVIMSHIAKTENSDNPNILLTKDIVTMQFAAMNKNTIVYRPKKYNGEDQSFYIDPSNNGLYAYLADERKCKQYKFSIEISSELYSAVLAMIGIKSRDMNSILTYSNCMKKLERAIINCRIPNSYNSNINNIYEEFTDSDISALLNGNIHGRFKALDLNFQYGLYQNNPERLFYKGLLNLYDPIGFHKICETYFKDYPLDVERM